LPTSTFSLIDKRKQPMDASGPSSRAELLSPLIDRTPTAHVHRARHPKPNTEDASKDARTTIAPVQSVRASRNLPAGWGRTSL